MHCIYIQQKEIESRIEFKEKWERSHVVDWRACTKIFGLVVVISKVAGKPH